MGSGVEPRRRNFGGIQGCGKGGFKVFEVQSGAPQARKNMGVFMGCSKGETRRRREIFAILDPLNDDFTRENDLKQQFCKGSICSPPQAKILRIGTLK